MAAKPKAVFIIGILAVAIAAVASISLYNYLKGQEAKVKEAVATENVVVAASDISIGTVLQKEQLKTVEWPKGNLPQGFFPSPEQVVGRVALDKYSAGEPIIEAKLVPKEGQGNVMTYKIPEGHRAMTVAVDQVSGVAGFITPGNKVDVVLTTSPTGAGHQVSKIVLQDVPVLATGQALAEQQKEGKPQVVPTVTVDVTPEDAEKLAIASTQGRLQLVLRRAGDVEVARTIGATVAKVMAGSGAPPKKPEEAKTTKRPARVVVKREEGPKRPAEEVINVTIFRGSQKAVETFKEEKK